MSHDEEGSGQYFTRPGQGQIMHFIVNESTPKPLAIATSNFAGT